MNIDTDIYCMHALHTTFSRNNMRQKCWGNCGLCVLIETKMKYPKNMKKSWETFGSYLLNSKANPAHFHSNWAGLAVLFIRKLPNGSDDFFHIFRILFLYGFIKNTQTTMAPTFLTHIISAIGGVTRVSSRFEFNFSALKIN